MRKHHSIKSCPLPEVKPRGTGALDVILLHEQAKAATESLHRVVEQVKKELALEISINAIAK